MSHNGSIKSGLRFESYKIDKIDFHVQQTVSVLSSVNHSDCRIRFDLGFRDALRIKENEKTLYITGLQVSLKLMKKEADDKPIAEGNFVITGLFSTTGELDKETEESLVKYQGPAILMPYIRATISYTLAGAGFSPVMMPLINVNAAAADTDIKVIDPNTSNT